MNPFDKAARYAAKLDPLGFSQWLLVGLAGRLTFRGWLDTRTLPFPGAPDRTSDTVADFEGVADPKLRWAVVVEFQTENEADMLDRLLEYLARLRRELRYGEGRREKYQVAAAVVNLTGPAQEDTLEMILPGEAGAGLRLQVVVRTLRDEDAAATLEGIAEGRLAGCILVFIPLMHGGGEPGIIERWKAIAAREPDTSLRSDYGELALTFAELTQGKANWLRGLEGWDVLESPRVNGWLAMARREDIFRALQLRFRTPVPDDLKAAVEGITDLKVVNHLFDLALISSSLEEFRAAVAVNGSAVKSSS
jgi:hypothetical protein